jgi:hypothetical protein
MKRFNVYIRTPGKMINYRRRVVRSPVELNGVTESEVNLLKVQFHCDGITDFEISEIDSNNHQENDVMFNSPNPISPGQEIIMDSIVDVEESISTPKSTMEKILLEDV